jgi:hypothetical protein
MDVRSATDMHTPSFAETAREGKSMHTLNNTKTVSEAINDDIKQSLIQGQQQNAQNADAGNVAALMGKGTVLNIMS